MSKQTENAPKAIGPYSPLVIAGELIFTSGQLGIDPETNKLKEGIHAQTVQAIKNLTTILDGAQSSLENVVKTTVFLQDMNDFSEVNKIYGEYFKEPYPARSAIQIGKLPQGGLIEIEAIAVISKK
jgi:2-iminobutanoate/2-iminopropanoate deaminase